MTAHRDTIYALSSGSTPSGVAIVRLSGPTSRAAVERICGDVPPPRRVAYRAFAGLDGDLIDHGLVLWFAAPASFTGEDCAELQCHGSPAVVAAILRTLSHIDGCRIAEAGEFTKRAFENGKLDLSEVEGLSDLIAAETEAQRRLALDASRGRQSALYLDWRRGIAEARARLEADIDFVDEEDVPDGPPESLWDELTLLADSIRRHCDGFRGGEIIRGGFRVVLAGAPNAGKSSLFNAIARRDIAIVTDVPGTTRDVLEVAVDIDGHKVIFADTAGLRETIDTVEAIGVQRALTLVDGADLVLLVRDLSDTKGATSALVAREHLLVGTKADLAANPERATGGFAARVSSRTGEGIEDLLMLIKERVLAATGKPDELLPARQRHVGHLLEAARHVEMAVDLRNGPIEVASEHLRIASDELGRIVGAVDADELLGIVFSSFCIGK